MSFKSPNYTQIPNELFDDWLGTLTTNQLKVLLYIMRHEFLFSNEKYEYDLSRIGLKSHLDTAEVMHALHGLVEYDLIELGEATGRGRYITLKGENL